VNGWTPDTVANLTLQQFASCQAFAYAQVEAGLVAYPKNRRGKPTDDTEAFDAMVAQMKKQSPDGTVDVMDVVKRIGHNG